MSARRPCPKCGVEYRIGSGLTKHANLCANTVEELLVLGNVDTSAGPDRCWMWRRGQMHPGDYGNLGRSRAHRVMYRVAHGQIPPRYDVCHTCDTPGCVNPAHLWVGTRSDNVKDAVVKGRISSPMRNPSTKERVRKALPRGDAHHTRNNPDLAARRVVAMLAARGIDRDVNQVRISQEPVSSGSGPRTEMTSSSQKEVMPK